jgi:sarcosine oxidase gamma subunit
MSTETRRLGAVLSIALANGVSITLTKTDSGQYQAIVANAFNEDVSDVMVDTLGELAVEIEKLI